MKYSEDTEQLAGLIVGMVRAQSVAWPLTFIYLNLAMQVKSNARLHSCSCATA